MRGAQGRAADCGGAPGSRTGGFTTLEILVTLAVVALVAALLAGSLRSPPASVRVMAEARQLAAQMQRLRTAAITTKVEQRFVVDTVQRVYGTPGARMVQIPDDMDISAELAAGAERGQGVVRFFPTGSSSGASIRLSVGNITAAVLVNWATGAVRVEGPPS